MKKLISSILALSLVAGMSVTAFAADGDAVGLSTGNGSVNAGSNLAYGQPYTATIPYSSLGIEYLATSQTAVVTGSNSDASAAYLGGTLNFAAGTLTNVDPASVSFAENAAGTGIEVSYDTLTSALASGTSVVLNINVSATGSITGTPASPATLPTNSTKTVVISGSLPSSGNYVSGYKIDDVIDGGDGRELGSAGYEPIGMVKGSTNLNNLDILPDAEIKVYLEADDFDWIQNDVITKGTDAALTGKLVSTSQLRNGKITIRKSVSKGSNVIEDISFDSDKAHGAYVYIEFVEWFVSVNEQDVDFTIYLAKSGSKRAGTELNIAGTMENEQDEVDEGDDYISTEDGTVFEAQDYVRNCEVYLGNGVYITTNLFKDKKYYGIALNTYDSTDSAIMDEYPEIDNVLTLKTINLKGSGNIVHFDMSGDYYVYGADGTYLGLSSEKVVYSDKYYFATERISINDGDLDDDDDLILDEDDDDDYVGPSDGGGDDANNANDNPGTGVNGFVGVAVAAGLISLAAVGVTARKKK